LFFVSRTLEFKVVLPGFAGLNKDQFLLLAGFCLPYGRVCRGFQGGDVFAPAEVLPIYQPGQLMFMEFDGKRKPILGCGYHRLPGRYQPALAE
jgi:hypothetical protein